MKWNTLDELPENGSLVWVRLPRQRPIVRLYQNDSFGLGEQDFEVTGWINYLGQSDRYLKHHDCKPLSTRLILGHTCQDFSELSLSLVR